MAWSLSWRAVSTPQTVASSPAKAGLAADIDKTNITVATDLAIRHCIARPD